MPAAAPGVAAGQLLLAQAAGGGAQEGLRQDDAAGKWRGCRKRAGSRAAALAGWVPCSAPPAARAFQHLRLPLLLPRGAPQFSLSITATPLDIVHFAADPADPSHGVRLQAPSCSYTGGWGAVAWGAGAVPLKPGKRCICCAVYSRFLPLNIPPSFLVQPATCSTSRCPPSSSCRRTSAPRGPGAASGPCRSVALPPRRA